ncbi:protein of unknown function [Magnetospira sp. QH-2]|nr:protein of unknown function [Magnetospira sp. QH-2]
MATRGARMTARRLQWRKTTLFRLLHPIPLDPHHAATTSTADRSKGRHIPQVQTDGLEISLTQMTRLQKQPANAGRVQLYPVNLRDFIGIDPVFHV